MRYTGPKCRLCRREGVKLFLKGDKCEGQKCGFIRRGSAPGVHPIAMHKPTEFARQLREKQKAKRLFGITEKQLVNIFKEASKKKEATGDFMMKCLELMVVNALYRSGYVSSRYMGRQSISHGLFTLNSRKIWTPSIRLKVGDVISLSKEGKLTKLFANKQLKKDISPTWMEADLKNYSFKIIGLPEKKDFDSIVEIRYLVEFYSKN